ncbi:hypothetical protein NBRC116493_07410 [Aurantivibrio infirmus]
MFWLTIADRNPKWINDKALIYFAHSKNNLVLIFLDLHFIDLDKIANCPQSVLELIKAYES